MQSKEKVKAVMRVLLQDEEIRGMVNKRISIDNLKDWISTSPEKAYAFITVFNALNSFRKMSLTKAIGTYILLFAIFALYKGQAQYSDFNWLALVGMCFVATQINSVLLPNLSYHASNYWFFCHDEENSYDDWVAYSFSTFKKCIFLSASTLFVILVLCFPNLNNSNLFFVVPTVLNCMSVWKQSFDYKIKQKENYEYIQLVAEGVLNGDAEIIGHWISLVQA